MSHDVSCVRDVPYSPCFDLTAYVWCGFEGVEGCDRHQGQGPVHGARAAFEDGAPRALPPATGRAGAGTHGRVRLGGQSRSGDRSRASFVVAVLVVYIGLDPGFGGRLLLLLLASPLLVTASEGGERNTEMHFFFLSLLLCVVLWKIAQGLAMLHIIHDS